MTEIRLYNTASRQKQPLEPLVKAGQPTMYVCGPTVYDRAHIGNARPVIVFDVLFRLLRHVYGAENVTYVRNFTDVDDRINETALKRKEAGASGTLEDLIRERSDETIRWYHDDMDALGALRPTEEPRATGYIAEMIAMIEGLIARGHAYAAEGHALFRVRSYAEYGALSGRSVDDMIAGARVEVAPYKEDPMDFVLWKPSSDDLPGWDGPKVDGKSIGRGRPGWHIECSAMAHGLLGERFDIHGGGNDLQFPHHENEIAQSKCAGHDFARLWMHNEMLQVEGKKMSKSLGNFFTVRDLLDQGVPGEVIRFVFLSTHYRKPMDWTAEKAREAEATLERWFSKLSTAHLYLIENWETYVTHPAYRPDDRVVEALANDLNTPLAIARMHELAKSSDVSDLNRFLGSLRLLGFLDDVSRVDLLAVSGISWSGTVDPKLEKLINDALFSRQEARKARKFREADEIRDVLLAAGVNITDTELGPEWELSPDFDPSKLEALK